MLFAEIQGFDLCIFNWVYLKNEKTKLSSKI